MTTERDTLNWPLIWTLVAVAAFWVVVISLIYWSFS